MFTKTDSQLQGKESDIVHLPTKSSSAFGYTMSIDLSPLNKFKQFWRHDANRSEIWQCLADNYINRPYLDIPSIVANYSYNLQHDNYTVYHRNHDVTHAVRQRHYAQNYLEIIAKYGKDEFSALAKGIINDAEIKTCLELAIFLCRSGRTNEQSGRDDPSNAKRSSELFTEVATRLGFDKGLIEFLAFSIATHKPDFADYSDLVNKLPGSYKEKENLAKLLYRIIDLSHHTDLVRCKTGGPEQPVRKDIEHELSDLLAEDKVDVPKAVSNLLTYAIQACKTTGTCVKYQEFGRENTDYNAELKVLHTKNVLWSMSELQKVELNIEQEIHNGKYGEFQELIKKVVNTKKLDLTNWTIDAKELKTLLEIIEKNELTSASLIGLKPNAHQQILVTTLQNKKQDTPILIKYAQTLDENSVNNFDQQFQQQARERLKVSMAFEPSRLARAKDKGTSALISQLIKEAKGDVPSFGGDQFATHVTGVTKLANAAIEQNYATVKQQTKVHKPLPKAYLAKMQTIDIPDIQLEDGEMLLYHGTGAEVSPLIMTNGFDENRCRYVRGNGYGPLGKGMYFTSELSKAATFSRCSQCNTIEQCSCFDKETMQPAERVVLLNRVYVGNAEILLAKNDLIKNREKPADEFDSCIALSQELNSKSDYRSTEICVPKGAQIIPLYEIRFTFTLNYLLVANWDKALSNNGLAKTPAGNFLELLKKHRGLLDKISSLKNSDDASDVNVQLTQLQEFGNQIIQELTYKKTQLDQIGHPDPQQQQEIKQLTIQLRDMNILQTQVADYYKQNQEIAVHKKEPSQVQEEKKTIVSSYTSFFTPKYVLKQKITTLNNALDKETFIPSLIESLDIAIAYNKKKDHSNPLMPSMFSSQPAHRIRLTQEMIRLHSSLKGLDKNDLVQADVLLSKAIDDLAKAADDHNNLARIKNSTAYKNLLQYQQKLQQLRMNESVESSDMQSSANNHSADDNSKMALDMNN